MPYGGGHGLIFEGKVLAYQEHTGKKGQHIVVVDVESDEDFYQYSFVVFNNGSTTLDVVSKQRNPISFSGYVNLDGEE